MNYVSIERLVSWSDTNWDKGLTMKEKSILSTMKVILTAVKVYINRIHIYTGMLLIEWVTNTDQMKFHTSLKRTSSDSSGLNSARKQLIIFMLIIIHNFNQEKMTYKTGKNTDRITQCLNQKRINNCQHMIFPIKARFDKLILSDADAWWFFLILECTNRFQSSFLCYQNSQLDI